MKFLICIGGASGGLYAGATAGNGIGANAALGGDTSSGYGSGIAQAYSGGVTKQVVSLAQAPQAVDIVQPVQTVGSLLEFLANGGNFLYYLP